MLIEKSKILTCKKGMAELERRREAIRQREEAERLEQEKKRAAEEAERIGHDDFVDNFLNIDNSNGTYRTKK